MNDDDSRFSGWDTEFLMLVGCVTVQWGLLEEMMHRAMWACAGLNEADAESHHVVSGAQVAWGLLHRQIARSFRGLSDHADALNSRFEAVQERRDRLVHGLWAPKDPVGIEMRDRRSASESSVDEMSEADLLDLAAAIIETRDELGTLVTRLQSGEGRSGPHVW